MKSWTDLLTASLQPVDKVPSRFKTAKQLAEAQGLNPRSIRERLTANASKIEIKQFRIKTGAQVRLTPHYAIR